MSEQYPTQAETQEWLNEIWATDPALYEYLMFYEEPDNDPYTDFGDYDERAYLMGEYDDETRR